MKFVSMGLEEREILQQFGEALIRDFQAIIPKVTGATAASLRMEVDQEDNILTIFGSEVLATLEDGRGPTQNDGPGDVIENLKAWLAAKGLNLSPFAVAHNIHKFGNTLFRSLQNKGPLNYQPNPIGLRQVLTQQRLDSFSTLIGTTIAPKISSELLPNLKPE